MCCIRYVSVTNTYVCDSGKVGDFWLKDWFYWGVIVSRIDHGTNGELIDYKRI